MKPERKSREVPHWTFVDRFIIFEIPLKNTLYRLTYISYQSILYFISATYYTIIISQIYNVLYHISYPLFGLCEGWGWVAESKVSLELMTSMEGDREWCCKISSLRWRVMDVQISWDDDVTTTQQYRSPTLPKFFSCRR